MIAPSPLWSCAKGEITSCRYRILDAKNYEKPNLKEEVVAKLMHLVTNFQRTLLMVLLGKHEAHFNSNLDEWIGDPVDIEFKPDAKPYHTKAYPIAHIHEATFKKDLKIDWSQLM